jgi:segregation and condensation protein B
LRPKHDGRSGADELVAALGAVIFASGEPVQPGEIVDGFDDVDADAVREAFERLARILDDSGVGLRLEQVAGGYQLATRPEVGDRVRGFFRRRNRTRLTPAALETLAIVAYRQPVTSPEIQAIRGKDPSAALRSLVEKKMIRILGKKKVVGSPLLYGTSKQFLVHFGLNSLEDLPSIESFDEFIGALEGARFEPAGTEDEPAEPEGASPLAATAEEAEGRDGAAQ